MSGIEWFFLVMAALILGLTCFGVWSFYVLYMGDGRE